MNGKRQVKIITISKEHHQVLCEYIQNGGDIAWIERMRQGNQKKAQEHMSR